jgi:DNA-binding NarL/FixJ family response regulator
MKKIRLLLVEDNKVVREALIRILENWDDFEVIGSASSGNECLGLLENGIIPDIILADLNMPGMDGITLTKKILSLAIPNVKVMILTMHTKQAFVQKAFDAGALGYLLKDGDFEEMYKAILMVNQNQRYTSKGTIPNI